MGNSLEKSSSGNSFLNQVEFNEPFTAADRQLFSGNIDEAWEEYLKVYRRENDLKPDSLVNLMIGLWRESYSRLTYFNEDDIGCEKAVEVFSCRKCYGLLYEPCTLSCGHTLCRKCIGKPDNFVVCFVCKEPSQLENWPTKLNVTLSSIIGKWFPPETEAARLRLQGNSYFCKKNYKKSIEKYTEGLKKNPSDHLLLGNRSNVYLMTGELEKAVDDAARACQLRPRWAKAHYRMAVALMTLNKFKDASVEFLKCVLLDSSNISVGKCLEKSLHSLLLQESQERDVSHVTTSQEIHSSIAELKLQAPDINMTQAACSSDQSSMDIDSASRSDSQSSLDSTESTESTNDSEEKETEESTQLRNPLREIVESFSNSSLDASIVADHSEPECCLRNQISETALKSALDDLECPLCCRILYDPTTTPCGHTFCKGCLSRCLDHNTACPICRFSLFEFVTLRKKETTEIVNTLLESFYEAELEEREKKAKEELENLARVATDTTEDIPMFICTLALPTLPCPLHIFEPRYRLMLRQCIESGSQQFGMTMYEEEKGFADYGCMVEIKAVKYLPDGRALVDTVGGRRFKVLSRGVQDGYRTAKVEWIYDLVNSEADIQAYRALNREVYSEAKAWFQGLSNYVQGRIAGSFGRFPDCCENPEENNAGPKWTWWLLQLIIDSPAVQLSFLASTSPTERLQDIRQRLSSFS